MLLAHVSYIKVASVGVDGNVGVGVNVGGFIVGSVCGGGDDCDCRGGCGNCI